MWGEGAVGAVAQIGLTLEFGFLNDFAFDVS
jgi:hypothetical protein